MGAVPACRVVAERGRPALAALCLAGLAACAVDGGDTPPPAYLTVDGLDVKVYHEPDIFLPAVPAEQGRDGRVSEVEAFPLTAGMAVARRDGGSLGPDDAAKAREAAEYYCRRQGGKAGKGALAGIAGTETGIWFFGGCAPAGGLADGGTPARQGGGAPVSGGEASGACGDHAPEVIVPGIVSTPPPIPEACL